MYPVKWLLLQISRRLQKHPRLLLKKLRLLQHHLPLKRLLLPLCKKKAWI